MYLKKARREIKKYPGTTEIPVIFLSALSETRNKLDGFSAGGVDIPRLIEETVKIFQTLAVSKELNIIRDISPQLSIQTDIDMLRAILRNLLSNAIKFIH